MASIEPMQIPKMEMQNGHGAVRVRAVFSNMTIYGASNYSVVSVKYVKCNNNKAKAEIVYVFNC